MDEVTPGYATTEFWITIGTTVLSAFTALMALFTPGFTIDPKVQQAVVAMAPIAAAVGAAFYAWSRSRVKAAALGLKSVKLELDANAAHTAALTDEARARTLGHLGAEGVNARKEAAKVYLSAAAFLTAPK